MDRATPTDEDVRAAGTSIGYTSMGYYSLCSSLACVRARVMLLVDGGFSIARNGSQRRPPGALEAEILATLWAADQPLTPAAVQGELGAELAYTTVMTALSRLHAKGVVNRERMGRAYAYTAVLDQPGIAAARMRQVLEAGQDREAVLARFVGSLSNDDERVLTGLLRKPRAESDTR